MSVFSRALVSWYRKQSRDLPWRRTSDPYKIWISEIMLQQTTVATVTPRYEQWIKLFPKIEDVAQATEQEVLKAWQGLGYYSRARNIKKTAEIVCQQYKGKLPADPELLRQLPGFGPYTVGAVSSIAFNLPEPIVDANVRRVGMRLLAIEAKADASHDKRLREYLKQHLSSANASHFNQGLMELGALICRPQNPLCTQCPINKFCLAYEKGIQELIPQTVKKQLKDISVSIAVIKNKNKFFIQRRAEKGLMFGLWEFPGGKIEVGESPEEALHREVREEVEAEIKDVKFLLKTKHFYTQYRVNIHAFICTPKAPIAESNDRKWVRLDEITAAYPMPSGSAKILSHLHALKS